MQLKLMIFAKQKKKKQSPIQTINCFWEVAEFEYVLLVTTTKNREIKKK